MPSTSSLFPLNLVFRACGFNQCGMVMSLSNIFGGWFLYFHSYKIRCSSWFLIEMQTVYHPIWRRELASFFIITFKLLAVSHPLFCHWYLMSLRVRCNLVTHNTTTTKIGLWPEKSWLLLLKYTNYMSIQLHLMMMCLMSLNISA